MSVVDRRRLGRHRSHRHRGPWPRDHPRLLSLLPFDHYVSSMPKSVSFAAYFESSVMMGEAICWDILTLWPPAVFSPSPESENGDEDE